MIKMITLLRIEWLKTKRTFFRFFLLVFPVAFALSISWKISSLGMKNEIEKDVFMLRNVFYTFFFPFLISFIPSYLIGYESIHGENAFVNVKYSKSKLVFSKVLFSLLCLSWILFAIDLIYFFTIKHLGIHIQYGILFFSSVIPLLGSFPAVLLHVLITFKWRMGLSLAIGTVGALLSEMINAGLGYKMWYIFPWSIPSTFNTYSIVLLKNIKINDHVTNLLSQFSPIQIYLGSIMNGITTSVIYSAILLLMSLHLARSLEFKETL
ncbi:lantibiotic protection ABC transporter permease subunit, MutG family [Fervidobacterium changbaicum]|uniref:Lantibiotic protection ABC transporter permease subunit, MutG family n=1 Tax=Fervidobacterium changbaicum TaxID=310769 RepID=A0ABX5QSI8_9BACT|nr:hypothetical protein [Fervidobacterium changbaicum]QAV33349.1 hypothetical protein CBS1_06200 [Fervidobacterium changbaicum]SDG89370.1 lantibiotic protection ABC transporter permease subunit, MutG family [Fervidobacterium changbaicum]